MSGNKGATKKIVTYVLLTLAISSIYYTVIITKRDLSTGGGIFVLGLMWSPALSAIITSLVYRRSLAEFGWGFGNWRYQLASYLIPIGYALVAYLIVWLAGLGGFYNHEFVDRIAKLFGWTSLPPAAVIVLYVLINGTLGMIRSSASALGEEIGWRGFLVPELAKVTSFTKVALISGIIWSLWHYPVLLFANYNGGTPAWYSLICFTVMVIAISFVFAWMRLKSGSLWTGVFLHASHNLFIQSIFSPLTVDAGRTRYFIDEFGAVLPIVCIIFAFAFWRMRGRLAVPGKAPEVAAASNSLATV